MQDLRPHQNGNMPSDLSLVQEEPRHLEASANNVRPFNDGITFNGEIAPVEFEQEVELASPWQRITARTVDGLLFSFIGVVAAVITAAAENRSAANVVMIVMLLAMLVLVVYQVVIMTRDGQSIGKKLMGIRVVNEDGENPGFVRYVLMREFGFNLVFQLISVLPFIGPIILICVNLACVVMLFLEERDRRTLQDMVANTYVIKV